MENFNKTVQDIEHNEVLMVSRITQLESLMTTTISHTDVLFAKDLINQIINLLSIILSIVQDTENSVTFCKLKVLHPSIITSEELLRELIKISKFYDKQLPFPVILSQIHNYENIIKPRCAIKGNQIIYFMSIPLLNADQYELFYFLPLPNKQSSIIVPSSTFGLKSKTMLLPLNGNCVLLNNIHQCQRNQISLVNNTCEHNILFKNDFTSCNFQKLQLEENTLEFIPELQSYIGIFVNKELVKKHCQDAWTALEEVGTYIFENSSCTIYIADRPLIFSDEAKGQPLHLKDLTINTKNHIDQDLPKLQIKHLELKNLETRLQPMTPASAKPTPVSHFHTSAIAIIYVMVFSAACWITFRVIKRRKKQTTATPATPRPDPVPGKTIMTDQQFPDSARFC